MPTSALDSFRMAAYRCAEVMNESASFIQKELASVQVAKPHQQAINEVCEVFVSNWFDIRTELDELTALELPDYSPPIRSRVDRVHRWLEEDLLSLHAVVTALSSAAKDDPQCSSAYILVAESAATVLRSVAAVADARARYLSAYSLEGQCDDASAVNTVDDHPPRTAPSANNVSAVQIVTRASVASGVSEPFRSRGQNIADDVFDSLRWTKVSGGIVQERTLVDSWKHRAPSDIEADLAYLEIDRAAVLAALAEYLSEPGFWTRELDWLFLNVLIYAEYTATVSEIRKKLLGIDRYVKSLNLPKAAHTPSVSGMAIRPWQAAAVCAVVAGSAFIHPWMILATGSATIYLYAKKRAAIREINTVLASMLRTYLSVNTLDLSWPHVAATLDESRRAGAIWDASLFKLAEVRRGAN